MKDESLKVAVVLIPVDHLDDELRACALATTTLTLPGHMTQGQALDGLIECLEQLADDAHCRADEVERRDSNDYCES